MEDSFLAPWAEHGAVLVHLGSTLALVGLIWTVQIVQYPLFAMVGDDFSTYHSGHSMRITWVVLPFMLAEAFTALWLVMSTPAGLPKGAAWLGLALVGVIWLSTFALQVPMHNILGRGFDGEAHRILVASNWLRTLAWSARGVLVLSWAPRVLAAPGSGG